MPVYDEIGVGYAQQRRADPRLAAPILAALGGSARIVNVGGGAGSYEPTDRQVVAVDLSLTMLGQREALAAPAVQARAEDLPFPSDSFDAAMAVLTIHHWTDWAAGLAELCRVARRRVVFTFDPDVHNRMWLMDYVPEIVDLESTRAPAIDEVMSAIQGHTAAVVPVPHDCTDGMTIAHWRHPERYLDPAVRQGGSALRQVDPAALDRGLRRLDADLRSGSWAQRYGDLMKLDELDCGLRLLVGGQ